MNRGDYKVHVRSVDRVTRPWAVLLLGLVLGALVGAAYAGVVAGSHWTSRGRWNRMLTFAIVCTTAGAAAGLAVGVGVAFTSPRRRLADRRDERTPPLTGAEPAGPDRPGQRGGSEGKRAGGARARACADLRLTTSPRSR
jgi:hypothetical protein